MFSVYLHIAIEYPFGVGGKKIRRNLPFADTTRYGRHIGLHYVAGCGKIHLLGVRIVTYSEI